MKGLVNDIIRFDKEAQETILALQKEKEELSIIIKNIKLNLEQQEVSKHDKLVAKLEAAALEQHQKQVEALQEKKDATISKLQEEYHKNHDKWLTELFAICLK